MRTKKNTIIAFKGKREKKKKEEEEEVKIDNRLKSGNSKFKITKLSLKPLQKNRFFFCSSLPLSLLIFCPKTLATAVVAAEGKFSSSLICIVAIAF